jgi:hypothetical protein
MRRRHRRPRGGKADREVEDLQDGANVTRHKDLPKAGGTSRRLDLVAVGSGDHRCPAGGAHKERPRSRDSRAPHCTEKMPLCDSEWLLAVKLFRDIGVWPDDLGPSPRFPGCKAPPHILKASRNDGVLEKAFASEAKRAARPLATISSNSRPAATYSPPKVQELTTEQWIMAIKTYQLHGVWSAPGNAPGLGGCLVPRDILETHGYGKKRA